ncbi:MAG: ATPase [Boseongicola sp. SB0676_bin_33]|uniref:ATPase n=1 Tax=Boseongicola sp. SB0664_bin_43 TaxID=2604844 RepID=A0A6B0Y0R0_9RHOB|nr:ATPase [Boseongicola sp. SB0664_bin_43]MYF88146.1 ATPase [Boseongicola sp. SB0676_bin_33]MYK33213.1 ATPase [Boseongicola sp. SB0670_bin_30]
MSEWNLKRVWGTVSVAAEPEGFSIWLDKRPVRTPAKRALVLPTQAIARHVAAEWEAQAEQVNPATMPWTRSANAAIDKVAMQRRAVIDHLAGYAGTDLLSYRAAEPVELVLRQQRAWDPLLDWLTSRLGVRFEVTQGVMPVEQDPASVSRLVRRMQPMSSFQLTGFQDLVTLSGSFVIALAAADEAFPVSDLWSASCLDEIWQTEQWGEDVEAAEEAARKMRAFHHAAELIRLA